YTLGSPGVAVDGLITLSDVDSAILHGATITIEDFTDGDTLIFASVGKISGSFDSNTGVLTLTGNDTIAAYQLALRSISYQNIDPDASTGDRTVTFQVNDGAVASNVATSTVHVDDDGGEETPNIAPVINIDDVTTIDDPDSTTVLGLSVSDADRVEGDIYTVTATALHGTLSASQGNPQSSIEFSEAFAGLNNKLAQGITYFDPAEPEQGATVNDKVTLTVTDADNNSDTINFIFNVYGEGGATLEGTSGKDILFSTGGADTLTGDINDAHSADTFVFDHDVSCEGIGADIIADFTVGQDKIALANFGYDDASQFGMAYNADLDALIITLAEGETISLDHVTQPLTNDSFIFHS
ncbi:MAG TPA: hypothetical protein VJL90_07390, partial [Pseudorhodoplanes sp.]|nr:hypothetical protein [Pseudorhodoplanes sp.]